MRALASDAVMGLLAANNDCDIKARYLVCHAAVDAGDLIIQAIYKVHFTPDADDTYNRARN